MKNEPSKAGIDFLERLSMKPTPYNAEILTIGNEIITGLVADTNSGVITRRLETLGIPVTRHVRWVMMKRRLSMP